MPAYFYAGIHHLQSNQELKILTEQNLAGAIKDKSTAYGIDRDCQDGGQPVLSATKKESLSSAGQLFIWGDDGCGVAVASSSDNISYIMTQFILLFI